MGKSVKKCNWPYSNKVVAAAAAAGACGVGGWAWAWAGPRIAAATRTAPPGPPHSPEEGLWCPFSLASHGRRTPLSAKTDYRLPLRRCLWLPGGERENSAAAPAGVLMVARRTQPHCPSQCTDALSHLSSNAYLVSFRRG